MCQNYGEKEGSPWLDASSIPCAREGVCKIFLTTL